MMFFLFIVNKYFYNDQLVYMYFYNKMLHGGFLIFIRFKPLFC